MNGATQVGLRILQTTQDVFIGDYEGSPDYYRDFYNYDPNAKPSNFCSDRAKNFDNNKLSQDSQIDEKYVPLPETNSGAKFPTRINLDTGCVYQKTDHNPGGVVWEEHKIVQRIPDTGVGTSEYCGDDRINSNTSCFWERLLPNVA